MYLEEKKIVKRLDLIINDKKYNTMKKRGSLNGN